MPDANNENNQAFLIYQDDNGVSNVTVRFEGEDVWLTAEQLQMLFQASRQDVAYHIKQIYDDGELSAEGTCKKFLLVRQEGSRSVKRQFPHYNLDMILAIGMRIRSEVAVRFRQWAIRQRTFFATVQNKLHYAAHKHTAAELIHDRVDAGMDHMGLTTWEDAPDGKIQKYDVTIAKNYLTEEEIGVMERMVNAFLDFAELKTLDHVPLTMEDWSKQLEAFLAFFDRHPAPYAGDPVTAFMAQQHAETEFEKFKPIQDRLFMSDYDRFLLELENQVEEMGDKSGGFEHAE